MAIRTEPRHQRGVMAGAPTILVFDSGLGGLTVHAEVAKALPEARYVYVADDAGFPYGRLGPDACAARVIAVVGRALAAFRPDLVVIACNTASTVALPGLGAAFAVPFVRTVPAVKPAAALSQGRMNSIPGTPGAVNREYTHDLIIVHAADRRVALVDAADLASLAEAHLRGGSLSCSPTTARQGGRPRRSGMGWRCPLPSPPLDFPASLLFTGVRSAGL